MEFMPFGQYGIPPTAGKATKYRSNKVPEKENIRKIKNKGTSEITLSYIRIVNSKEGKLLMQKVL
jgi:hypothetical protein